MQEGEVDVLNKMSQWQERQHLLPTVLRYILFLDFETKFLENVS
jgi:hypothetical protein